MDRFQQHGPYAAGVGCCRPFSARCHSFSEALIFTLKQDHPCPTDSIYGIDSRRLCSITLL